MTRRTSQRQGPLFDSAYTSVLAGFIAGGTWLLTFSPEPADVIDYVDATHQRTSSTESICIPCESKLTYAQEIPWEGDHRAQSLSITLKGLGIQSSWSDTDRALIDEVFRDTSHELVGLDDRSRKYLQALAVKVSGRFLGTRGGSLAPADRTAWHIIELGTQSSERSVRFAACQAAEFCSGRSAGLAEGFLYGLLTDEDLSVRTFAKQALQIAGPYEM